MTMCSVDLYGIPVPTCDAVMQVELHFEIDRLNSIRQDASWLPTHAHIFAYNTLHALHYITI